MHKHSIAPKTLVCLTLALLGFMNWTSILSRAADRPGPTGGSSAARNSDVTEANRDRAAGLPEPRLPEADSATRSRVAESYARRPLRFESNQGQTDSRVKFLSRNEDYDLFLTSTETVLLLNGPAPKSRRASKRNSVMGKQRRAVLRMRLEGANPAAEIEGLDEQPGKSNYFVGRDAGRWRTDIAGYSKVQYRSIYPGVDLVYYGKDQSIESDFVVAAGADYRNIKFAIKGAKRIRIDASGDLVLTTPVGEVRQHKPFVYQEVDGERQAITASYVLAGKRQVSFEIGAHDAGRPLVIDPVLDYSTFLGGTSTDEGRSIVVDSGGNAYITGRTYSFNFPVTISSFDTTYANSSDVFVTKLNAAASDLVYSTFLGGNSDDSGFGIVVDSTGQAYVTGSTSSNDYPTTLGAYQPTARGGSDGFVTKLNSAGTALLYSTYLGGASYDQAFSIAVDLTGNAYLTGNTISTNFPTTPGAFQTTNAGGASSVGDAFIAKLNTTGTGLVYSTFLGGVRDDQGTGIVVDSFGQAFVTGSTNSTDFDVTVGAFQTTFGGSGSTYYYSTGDAFVTELNDIGTALVYSTYIGGSNDEGALGIALNSSGEAFIAGITSSYNFPVTGGVVRVVNGGAAKSIDAAASWAGSNRGLTDNSILSFVIDPATPSTVYAGTSTSGMFKSTDGGANWIQRSSGLTNLTIRSLAIDQSTPSMLYLGTNGRGVFRSTESGASWRGINTGQGGSSVNTLAIDPSNTSVIYAGTDVGVFKTSNGGASWTASSTGINSSFIHVLTIDPFNPSNLYAGTFNGVFRSTNGGQNWSLTSLNSGSFRALVIDASAPANVYAGGDRGLSKSTDQGLTWRGINMGLSNRTVNALAIPPASSSVVYAGTGNGVFKSFDGGGVWSSGSSGLAGSVINTLAIDPAVPATLYSGSASGAQDGFAIRVNAAGSALLYSTYLGGSNNDSSTSIAIDASDNAYITGQTASLNFPTTPGTFQTSSGYDYDSYVSKLNATGTGFVYSTYLGGSNTDQGFGIAVNSSGNAYVTGTTSSSNFPTTPGAFQTVLSNYNGDAFVTKLTQVPSLTAELNVTLTGPSGTITAGQYINYNITVTNNGPDAAFSVFVTDELSSLTSFSGCNSDFGSCSVAGTTVTFSFNTLAAGATLNATVSAYVNCSGPPSGTVVNTVTLESLTPDPDATNNSKAVSNASTTSPQSLSPTSQAFSAAGGTSYLQVLGPNCTWSATSNVGWVTITNSSGCCNGYVNYSVAANPRTPRTGTMTVAGQTFTVIQGGTTSATTIGLFRPSSNFFFLRNTNSLGAPDIAVGFGAPGDLPIVGDWDGNGTVTIGLYRPSSSTFFLRNTNTLGPPDITLSYGDGPGGDLPVAGDWDGNGTWTIGVYRPSTSTFFIRNSNSAGVPDIIVAFGAPGDMPIVGDWDGNGTMSIGLFRPSGNFFLLRNTNSAAPPDVTVGFGAPGDLPIVGDWDGNGTTTIGLFRPTGSVFFLRNTNSLGAPDITVSGFGASTDKPLAGNWDGM